MGKSCNCPPSYVIWSCSEEQYASIMNGTACAYYRHKHCNGVFCPDEAAVEAALAAEEITTELLAAEVVNTTTAGFTTGGLAETQRPILRLRQQRRLRNRVPTRAGAFLLPVLPRGGQQPSAQQMPPVLHRVLNRAGYDECSTEPVKPLAAV